MKKKLSKLFALLLAAIMVLAMGTTAFAASITVENAGEGETYSAFKIFDVTTSGEGENATYAYTITESSAWYSVVSTYAQTADNGLTLTQSADGSCYVVTIGEGFSAANFAAALASALSDRSVTVDPSGTSEGGTIDNLDAGYYLVTCSDEAHALAELLTATDSVTITDKNVIEDADKQQKDSEGGDYGDEALSVEIGDTVYYQITATVPDMTGYSTYYFAIQDTLSEGLTLDASSIKVTVNGVDVSDWTVNTTPSAEDTWTFQVSCDDLIAAGYEKGDTIVVTYTATVNENAVAGVYENKANLEYSNDPTNSSSTTTTTGDETDVYNATIGVFKYTGDDENSGTALAGASFVLQNSDGKYYKYTAATDEAAAKVEWVDSIDEATVLTTNDQGALTDSNGNAMNFVGLEDGTYTLIETAAPAGYNMLTQGVEIKIDGQDSTSSSYVYTQPVQNNAGSILPGTGGMGTTILYVIGIALVLGAGITLVVRRRMGAQK